MYTSNVNRVTGLSGVDTDTLIEKMMYAESSKLYRYQRQVQWKTWQQTAYRDVISKLNDFRDKYVSTSSNSFRFSAAFQNFKSQVLDSSGNESKGITIESITGNANYEIYVEKTALKDTYVGGAEVGRDIEGSINSQLIKDKLSNGSDQKISFKVTLDGTSKEISFNAKDLTDMAASTGVDAYNEKNIEAVINEKLKNTFGTEEVKVKDASGNDTGTTETKSKVTVSINSGAISLNTILGHTISISDSAASSESSRQVQTSAEALENAIKDLPKSFSVKLDGKTYNVKIDEKTKGKTYAEKVNNALASVSLNATGTKKLSDYVRVSYTSDEDKVNGKLTISNLSSTSDVEITGSNLDGISDGVLKSTSNLLNYFGMKANDTNIIKSSTTLESFFKDDSNIWFEKTGEDGKTSTIGSITINNKTIEFTKDTTLATFLKNIEDQAKVKASYNSTTQKFTFESVEEGAVNQIEFGTDTNTNNTLKGMGFDTNNMSDESQHTKTGRDAVLNIDGIRTTRSSNSISLDGVNFTINEQSQGQTLKISSEYDVDATFDKIKSFVDDYNTLIADLNKGVKETRAKSDDYTYYEPLTDAEKKEMSEDEIKLWEEKAKTGLLYRDDTINSILSKMRSAVYGSIKLGTGETIGLYQLGITTSSNYTDNGKLIIDEDKLKEAIRTNGSAIQELFTGNSTQKGIADKLSEIIDSATGTKGSLREKAGIEGTASANENILSKAIKELNEKITSEKERLVNKETKYYEMFASMEAAITQNNSQMDYLTSLLNG